MFGSYYRTCCSKADKYLLYNSCVLYININKTSGSYGNLIWYCYGKKHNLSYQNKYIRAAWLTAIRKYNDNLQTISLNQCIEFRWTSRQRSNGKIYCLQFSLLLMKDVLHCLETVSRRFPLCILTFCDPKHVGIQTNSF